MNISPEDINEDDQVPLPGFRFHPTDEELVSFYLRRKVEKRPISLELIKQIDIYKHNPWDLPYASCNVGDKEWYFFCRRGRKYKNSVRPNRVTGAGFWKATGIDKPVYSNGGEGNDCIGLKKTLVFYRGSAGKGTKTDWMMHEFRLPHHSNNTDLASVHNIAEEAEVWTLCRIFKRNVSYKRYTPNWTETSRKQHRIDKSLKTNYNVVNSDVNHRENYINFSSSVIISEKSENKPNIDYNTNDQCKQLHNVPVDGQFSSTTAQSSPMLSPPNSSLSINHHVDHTSDHDFGYGNWDELRSVVEFALDPSLM